MTSTRTIHGKHQFDERDDGAVVVTATGRGIVLDVIPDDGRTAWERSAEWIETWGDPDA